MLSEHPKLLDILKITSDLDLPDSWIGAGTIRNCVWDAAISNKYHLSGDIDLIFYDRKNLTENYEKRLTNHLNSKSKGEKWSVKNQARMHVRNGHRPYLNSIHALSYWTETATSVAARLAPTGRFQLAAPYTLDDLLCCVARPTRYYNGSQIFRRRIHNKGWKARWPILKIQTICLKKPDCSWRYTL